MVVLEHTLVPILFSPVHPYILFNFFKIFYVLVLTIICASSVLEQHRCECTCIYQFVEVNNSQLVDTYRLISRSISANANKLSH